MTESKTNRVDLKQAGANMYGVVQCPKCKRAYRYPMQDGEIKCDDCGFTERAEVSADD